jgi:hypothetical protein
MEYRKMRIAWSVACGIACLLVMVLWAISFTHAYLLRWQVTSNRALDVGSENGKCKVSAYLYQAQPGLEFHRNDAHTLGIDIDHLVEPLGATDLYEMGSVLRIVDTGSGIKVIVSHVIIVALFAVASSAPWLRPRFSLRTLLIATTLVAMGLGWAVYSLKK